MPTIYRLNRTSEKEEFKYVYRKGGKVVTEQEVLDYIKSLAIPPAYKDVEIYYSTKPKILFMGYDAAGRPQFIYSKWWTEQQREIKLCNLIPFGKALPTIMRDIDNSIRKGEKWTKNRVVSLVLKIISNCYFRVGNLKYEHKYDSYGITTITAKHVKFLGVDKAPSGVHINFIGKKAQENECTITDNMIITALKHLVETGRGDDHHVFKYQLAGDWHHVKHTDVNDFLKEYNPDFTSKMFRTFDTNTMLIKLLQTPPKPLKPSERKRKVVEALNQVSATVHNTPAICRKDYADPDIIDMYLTKPIKYRKYFITPTSDERVRFINYLEDKCSKAA